MRARGPSRSSSGNYILLPSAAARHYRWKNNQRHYRRQCRRRQPETLATMYFSFKPFDTHTLVTDTVCDTLVAKTQLASDNLKWSVSTQWQNVTTSSCRGRKNGKMHRSETGSCRKSAALPPHSDKKTFRQARIILFPNNSWIFKKEKRDTVYQICWFCISCCADGNHLYWCHHLDFMPG